MKNKHLKTNNTKVDILKEDNTKTYQYITLVVKDKKLKPYELYKIWNYGYCVNKDGSKITIGLRKKDTWL